MLALEPNALRNALNFAQFVCFAQNGCGNLSVDLFKKRWIIDPIAHTKAVMEINQAIQVIQNVAEDFGNDFLEVMTYMKEHHVDFEATEQAAFNVVFTEMSKLIK